MSEPDFESQLAALYREPSTLPDDAAFLAQVDAQIDQHVRRRRWILISLGLFGGAITFAALLRLGANVRSKQAFALILDAVAGAFSSPWSSGLVVLLVALLVLPAFMRAAIDPK